METPHRRRRDLPIVVIHVKFPLARDTIPSVPAQRFNSDQICPGTIRALYASHWKQCSQYQRKRPIAPCKTRIVRSPHGHMGVGFCRALGPARDTFWTLLSVAIYASRGPSLESFKNGSPASVSVTRCSCSSVIISLRAERVGVATATYSA